MRIRLAGENLHFECSHFIIRTEHHSANAPLFREPVHGHSYQVAVELEGTSLSNGYLFDFLEMKALIKAICKGWDHHVIIPTASPHLKLEDFHRSYEQSAPRQHTLISATSGELFVLPTADLLMLDIPYSSAECLAAEFGRLLIEKMASLPTGNIQRLSVTIFERPEQGATWEHVFA